MTHPVLERKHLEALLVARAALEQSVAALVDPSRLSPAATELLEQIAEWPRIAAECLESLAGDEYQARLARRATRLTVEELGYFSRATLVALINQLPAIGARRAA